MKRIETFTAVWCGPCKMVKPILEDLSNQGIINWVNHDIDEERELAIANNVRSVPTLIFYDENDNQTNVISGYMPKDKILEFYGAAS